MANYLNYYESLGVSQSATPDEIKAAFKKMAAKFHPDVVGGLDTTAMMSILNEARTTLLDPELRRIYDEELNNPLSEPNSSSREEPPPQGPPRSYQYTTTYSRNEPKAPAAPPARSPLGDYISKCRSWEMFVSGMFFNVLTYEQWSHNIPGISGLFPLMMWVSWISFWFVPKTTVRKVLAALRKRLGIGTKAMEPKK